MNQEDAIRIAKTEIETKQWGATQQTLASQKVVTDIDNQPVVARVTHREQSDIYEVYFPIDREPYYQVILIGINENKILNVIGSYIEAKTRAYILISSSTLSTTEITNGIMLSPTSTHSIGDIISDRSPLRKYKQNKWIFEPQKELPASIEEKIETVISAIEQSKDMIGNLGKDCSVSLNIVYHNWAGDPQFGGLHLNEKAIRILGAIHSELDIDLYATGPEMIDE